MQLNIYNNYETLSFHVADEIIALVSQKPDSVLCFASGDTPRLAYASTIKKAMSEHVDFGRCTFIGLDEWVGIPPDNEGSCHYFLQQNIFKPLNIAQNCIHLFDVLVGDVESECRKMDTIISAKGGIDLMIVGIGMNGHIGFNEPSDSFKNQYSHVVDLDEATKIVGQKYFRQQTTLAKGVTLGLNHVLQAKKVILIANGLKKADIIRKALEEEVTPSVPASIIRKHVNGCVMIDDEAASSLKAESRKKVDSK
jgi:glucosamine-6-phosphate isomerase